MINRPELYKMPNTKSYICMGDPFIEDMAVQAQKKAAEILQTLRSVLAKF